MPADTPIVGQWYKQLKKGREFKVTAVDEETGMVEMQHVDGGLEEVDLETWSALEIKPIAPRDEWLNSTLDDVEPDDLYDDTDLSGGDWSSSLPDRNERLFGNGEDDDGRW